ncbi:uncharacterized protein I206_101905 [Kwoniella pini CBS 10737]|uniref:Uncharacterized protein n=1 Tax=Kwoniella pini CBS 10737 TaxID=1296096 RepID=A0A1B9HVC8_9TREE|nr:uncharacterized protein I206_07005 [Kwoniella pini CBS 10737]OCF47227.1 hypothetical protein I206_07005 [Kwoniella pini CBS 10737]
MSSEATNEWRLLCDQALSGGWNGVSSPEHKEIQEFKQLILKGFAASLPNQSNIEADILKEIIPKLQSLTNLVHTLQIDNRTLSRDVRQLEDSFKNMRAGSGQVNAQSAKSFDQAIEALTSHARTSASQLSTFSETLTKLQKDMRELELKN